MTDRLSGGILLFVLGVALSSCGQSPTTPTPIQSLSPPGPTLLPTTPPPPRPPPPASVLVEATLSGRVYEVISDSPREIAGIEGVLVYCEQCGESTHNSTYTDSAGNYVFPPGVWTEGRPDFPVRLYIRKAGYKDPPGLPPITPGNPSGPGWREVVIDGDTRFDAELVRQ